MSTLVLGGATIPFMARQRSGKSLSDSENAHLREVIRTKLLPKYDDNQTVAGPKVGVTQAAISRIIKGEGGSLALAKAVAKDLGLTLSEVLGWPVSEAPKSGEPRFGDNPQWRAASQEARRLWGDLLPSFAYDRADNTKGGSLPAEITPKAVFKLAQWWFDTASMEERIAAERAEILAKKAEEDAAQSSHQRPVEPVDATTPKRRKPN